MSKVLKNALMKTPLYSLAKSVYRHTIKREYLVSRTGLENFYRPLISPGALVFDVGANHGDFSDAYLRLGAKVVAVEPHPGCAEELRALYGGNRNFNLLAAALGAQVGEVKLFLGENGMDNVSTVSQDFIARGKNNPGLAGARWSESVVVQQRVLEDVIRTFGVPDFCKIDVEGYEFEVIKGLSQPLPLLQFEYQPWAIEEAVACADYLSQLGMRRFNITLCKDRAEKPILLPDWIDVDSMIGILRNDVRDAYVGDVFVTRG